MEQISDKFPILCSKHPWLVAQNLEHDEDQLFFTVHDPMSHYRCRIPQLVGRRIRGCLHGWMILSEYPHDYEWSLWNPITTKFIQLPRLELKDGSIDDIDDCCLTLPPDHPGSILLLTRFNAFQVVFCRLDRSRKWVEISYFNQIISLSGDHQLIFNPTCCNGKLYAQTYAHNNPVVQVEIEKEDVISLLPLSKCPAFDSYVFAKHKFLKVCRGELFIIIVLADLWNRKPFDVYLYKLDMVSMEWIEIKDLKDTVFFVDLAFETSPVHCSPAIASELGGYIHIIYKTGQVIYSYDIKDKTISMSSVHSLGLPPRPEETRLSGISVWAMPEFRLEGDDDVKCKDDLNIGSEMVVISAMNDLRIGGETNDETKSVVDIPFDILDMIIEFCADMEYINLRATCKHCRFAAPVIPRNNNRRLHIDQWISPWLVVFNKKRGIISFTDPMYGDNNCFIKTHPELFYDYKILCSKHGWLLLYIGKECPAFFNPFTNDIYKLPPLYDDLNSYCFSAPPTSPDCMVVAFERAYHSLAIHIHFIGGGPSWKQYLIQFGDVKAPFINFPLIFGRDVYALTRERSILVFEEVDNFSIKTYVDEDAFPRGCSGEYFQLKCDQHHLLVIVGEFGEAVDVFKLNEATKEWEKIDSLGRHMIFIDHKTCMCMDAKTPEMENKIYFPRFHCNNGGMMFYSLETCRYHTFNGRNVEENKSDFFGTKIRAYAQAWIEPTWS